MNIDEWEKMPSEITLGQFLRIIHRFTEKVKVYVVVGSEWLEEREKGRHLSSFFLTHNAFERLDDDSYKNLDRLLKYYADVPVWNITAQFETVLDDYTGSPEGHKVGTYINANCHFRDIRDAWRREQDDLRREKRREYERKRRERKGDS